MSDPIDPRDTPLLMEAIVKSYIGPHHACIQVDPPGGDGLWRSWLVVRNPGQPEYALAGGQGADFGAAISTLAGIRGIETAPGPWPCDVCGKDMIDMPLSQTHEHAFPGGLVLDVCSIECLGRLDG